MIEAAGLTKHFGATRAVDDVSFTVAPGRITGFLGPNGAGKTTTLRMLVGLETPTSGSARICGTPYAALENPARSVGVMLESGWVAPKRSARNHLKWLAAGAGVPVARVAQALELVGLQHFADDPVGSFSLGMRQRLGIVSALLADPDVVILDEPINGLDPESIRWIRKLLRRLADDGHTVLVSSHVLTEVELTVDHVVIIDRGRLIADAPLDEFMAKNASRTVRVRTHSAAAALDLLTERGFMTTHREPTVLHVGADAPDAVGAILGSANITVQELTLLTESLEDVYFSLTSDGEDE